MIKISLAILTAGIGIACYASVISSASAKSYVSINTSDASGGFVSYANLEKMPRTFVKETEENIAYLPARARAAVLKDLPAQLRGQERQVINSIVPKPPSVNVRDASGCNDNVCIDITGSGLRVTWWNTQAFGNAGCIYSYYFKNNVQVTRFGKFCSNGQDGVYYNNWNVNALFDNGDKLCNTWGQIAGEPCEFIEG